MPHKPKIDWNIKLDFEAPAIEAKPDRPPAPPKTPPRDVLKVKFPRILDRINLLWGTLELHRYFEQTIFTDRDKRQGFPPEVMHALGEIYHEHQHLLMSNGLIRLDVWDMQHRDVMFRKRPK
jgi:hypothetical protein